MNNLSRLWTPDQAGDFLGMTGRHVRRLAAAGALPPADPTLHAMTTQRICLGCGESIPASAPRCPYCGRKAYLLSREPMNTNRDAQGPRGGGSFL